MVSLEGSPTRPTVVICSGAPGNGVSRSRFSPMIPKHNFITWCRKLRDELKEQLDALEAGSFRLQERRRLKWFNATAQAIARTKAQLAEIDELLIDVRPQPTRSGPKAWSRVLETFPGTKATREPLPPDNVQRTREVSRQKRQLN
jgi:hypothetical protein